MVAEEDLKEFYRCMLTVSEDKDGLAVEGLRFESIAFVRYRYFTNCAGKDEGRRCLITTS